MIFNRYISIVSGVANNVVFIAAPGAGLAIVLQSLQAQINAAPAGTKVSGLVHDGAGTVISEIEISGTAANALPMQTVYPGGLKLPPNSALQIDIAGGLSRWGATYAIIPA